MEFVTFKMFNGLYAFELTKTKEILVYSKVVITNLFTEKEWILGVINLRGEVTPIVDLRKRFGDENPSYFDESVIIIVRTSQDKLIGVVVDFIESIKEITSENIVKTPINACMSIDEKYIKGLRKLEKQGMITLLDIDKILDIEEM